MTLHLDQAWQASSDPLNGPAISFAHTIPTGRCGRPKIEINPNILSTALTLRPKTQIANTAGCSAQTIHRRQLDYGIITPGPTHPHHPHHPASNNNHTLSHSDSISDDELDRHLAVIIQDFPTFGH